MKYKTEKFDLGYERGKVGPCFDTLEEAKQWCHEECERESVYINVCNIYSVRDASKDWHAPDVYSCIWSDKTAQVVDITEEWNNRQTKLAV